MKSTLIACLLAVSPLPAATAGWYIPKATPMSHSHYDKQTDTHVFRGRMRLNGKLIVRWDSVDDEKYLDFRFQPDTASRRRLPFIPDAYHKQDIEIQLSSKSYQDGRKDGWPMTEDRQNLIRLIRQKFPDIPAGFWTAGRGGFTRPATLDISEFWMFVECDKRNYHATVSNITPKGAHSRKAPEGSGC
ncbi:MAG: hypothetical protein Q3966_00350 [Neisseria sp.]|nr:hypothetical protein [Neisseria sp.]